MARIAIVDHGLGNLFSVREACRHAGLDAEITADGARIEAADAVILPGVGAFGDAMATLAQAGLVETLRAVAYSGRPFFGICLGMQLLMRESTEFGEHRGLGLIDGTVRRFEPAPDAPVKVPQIGWNRIARTRDEGWDGTLLAGVNADAFMYFVHSYYVVPEEAGVALATTRYGDTVYCSALARGNVFGCQFHPERSGTAGLRLYENLARGLAANARRDSVESGTRCPTVR